MFVMHLVVCFFDTSVLVSFFFFFFNDTATTEIYTLSLHDALPISWKWRKDSTRKNLSQAVSGPYPDWTKDRKSTRLNSSHVAISYAVFCLKKKKKTKNNHTKNRCKQNHTKSHAKSEHGPNSSPRFL